MRFHRLPNRFDVRPWIGMAGLFCAAGLGQAQDAGMSELARAEMARRAQAATEAGELLVNGDAAYEAGRYAEAMEAYRGAIDLLPENAPAVGEQRRAALQRFSQASVERAREMRRFGNLKEANRVVDAVLADNVAPDDAAALAMREELLDPIRTNPVGTKEQTADVEEVRLLLYKAGGAYDLGNYDQARAVYEEVLRIDPYNTAARRGMERVDAARSNYFRAAYDQTRGEMLAMVDREWETPVPPVIDLRVGGGFGGGGGVVDYIDKLDSLRIPVAVLDDVTLQEAVDLLRQQSIQLDILEPDPLKRGINFVIDVGGPDSEIGGPILSRTFSLNLRDVSLGRLIEYIAESSGTAIDRQPFAVVFRPLGADLGGLVSRTYRVPPDFLTSSVFEQNNDAGGGGGFDPFAPEPENNGLTARRLTAEEKLKNLGVPFPEGATAAFYAGTSSLQVRNTPLNHSLIEQIISTIANDEPASIVVEVKLIRTKEQTLSELGFDWVLSPFNVGGSLFAGGGTRGNGGALGFPVYDPSILEARPITSGNRSGTEAIASNAIDQVISAGTTFPPTRRAPGVVGFNGVFGDAAVGVLLRALDQKKGTNLAAVPSVVTRSGQQASVEIMREFIYPTEYEPPELPNAVGINDQGIYPVTPATPTAFEMRPVGVTLEVLPTASRDKRYVDLSLKPNVTDFDGFVNYGSPILGGGLTNNPIGGLFGQVEPQIITQNEILMPVFSKTGTETAITVADGATIVIGGLLEERVENVEDSVPILGDVPVVGRLFQSKASAPTRSAIVFLVKVRVVDAAGRPFHP